MAKNIVFQLYYYSPYLFFMKKLNCGIFLTHLLFFCFLFATVPVNAQPKSAKPKKVKKVNPEKSKLPYSAGPLFNDEEILRFKLTGRLREILSDRGENVSYHPMLLQYKKKDSTTVSIPLQVRARGHFRRRKENCTMAPLLLNIEKSAKLKSTLFEKQDKLKLVTPCKGDEYVIKEYLVYKLYNLFTPKSFKARLVQVEFEDSLQKRKPETHYCMLVEDENKLAKRNGFIIADTKMISMEALDPEEFTRAAVFQYMIGNTDWSVPYLHNIKLIKKDSMHIPDPIPYDFDHSGIVSAPYAMPAEQLNLPSVRDRLYRGYCQNISAFNNTIAEFNRLKDDIYKVYTSCTLLDPKDIKTATRYLDDFYKIINNPKTAERAFTEPCRATERIVIQGYDE